MTLTRSAARTSSSFFFGGRLGAADRTLLLSLYSVLRSGLCSRLPLHVRRDILAALRQRNDVIHDVAGAAIRISGLAHEVSLGGFAPLNFSAIVSWATLAAVSVGMRRLCLGKLVSLRIVLRSLWLRNTLCFRTALTVVTT